MSEDEEAEGDGLLASYAQAELNRFRAENNLSDQESFLKAVAGMRRTAMEEGFSKAEIGRIFDGRMLSILLKAAKYDDLVAMMEEEA